MNHLCFENLYLLLFIPTFTFELVKKHKGNEYYKADVEKILCGSVKSHSHAALTFSGFYLQTHTLYQPLKVYAGGVRGNNSHECLNSNSIHSPPFVAGNMIHKQFACIEILGELLNLTEIADFRNLSQNHHLWWVAIWTKLLLCAMNQILD